MPLEGEFVVKNEKEHTKKGLVPHPGLDLLKAKPQRVGLFSSYCPHPEGITFENQDTDEEIVLFLRRHFITNLPWILGTIFLALIPPIIPILLTLFSFSIILSPSIVFAIFFFYYLILTGFVILRFALWYFHTTFVTTKRVVDIDIINLLNKDVAEAFLEVIIDVQYNQSGVLASLFNFGNIRIQTESIEQKFELDATPRPREVAGIIGDLVEEAKK